MEGLPVAAYIAPNVDDIVAKQSSASFLIRRIGCRSGTIDSGDIRHNIEACFVSAPRMIDLDHATITLSIPDTSFSAAC